MRINIVFIEDLIMLAMEKLFWHLFYNRLDLLIRSSENVESHCYTYSKRYAVYMDAKVDRKIFC
ncbi:MAG: hypothetical protein LBU04_00440 [Christensenellaceae bacterium]|jgi:hypothetical protein|nr:hypothetical protein [Christensenellaceae bacterium]